MSADQEQAISEYLAEVGRQLATGQAAEHAYRPALKLLIESFGGNTAVNDPKRSEYGAPDFVFVRDTNSNHKLGYAEAKDVGVSLDATEKSEQLTRYSGYSNLFLTDYLEFRFFRNGRKHSDITVAEIVDGKLVANRECFAALAAELEAFLASRPEAITDGAHLANVMGGIARRLRYNVARFVKGEGDEAKNDELNRIFDLLKDLLVHDLNEDQFADMYAQTLVYGLFAARYNDSTPETFTRQEARDLVPASNPFLRQFFDHIAGPQFDSRLAFIVDELCEVFSVSAVKEIVHRHLAQPSLDGSESNAMDPIIHFYEDFLRAYDPDQRRKMGAYYTPVPVVRYMVRMVDRILREEFDLVDGLADTSKTTANVVRGDKRVKQEFHKVQILDPAVGTATFLNEIIKFVHRGFEGQEGRWPSYAKEDLVPRLHGFELMMAPYTVAHLKLGLTLRETGVDDFGGRLGVYLTNTLEEAANMPQTLFHFGLAEAVAQEAILAGEVKSDRPIMLVIGNPPYAVESFNKTEHATAMVSKYKVEPGGQIRLRERNSKMINDDYVKFLAFAEDLVLRNGSGVVAMITNHGYLDNPTFRGVRWHLRKSFDRILVLDLHGNATKKEVSHDGRSDQNVFDIKTGVSIVFAIKRQKGSRSLATVERADIFGTRSSKFSALDSDAIAYEEIVPDPESHDFSAGGEYDVNYDTGVSLPKLFRTSAVGIKTSRDNFAIDFDERTVRERIRKFCDRSVSDTEIVGSFGLTESASWSVATARNEIGEYDPAYLREIDYRPFDRRWIYWHSSIVSRPRTKEIRHMVAGKNVALVVGRQGKVVGPMTWNLIAVTAGLLDNNFFYRGGELVLPITRFSEDGVANSNIDHSEVSKLRPFSTDHVPDLEVVDYCFGRLCDLRFREANASRLRTDYPKVPIAPTAHEWDEYVATGRRLRELQLMRSPESRTLITKFPVAGTDEVEKPRFDAGKVWINATQYFDGVPEVAWSFYVGGYQPAQKWLKDRKGRKLTSDELVHYQRVIAVLTLSDQIMRNAEEQTQSN